MSFDILGLSKMCDNRLPYAFRIMLHKLSQRLVHTIDSSMVTYQFILVKIKQNAVCSERRQSLTEAHSESCQTSKVERFAKIVIKDFQSLIIFAKRSIFHV